MNCHPDRSEAQWRDLRLPRRSRSSLSIRVAILPESNRPLLVIPTVAKRSGGICSAPCGSLQSFLGSDPPKKSQPPTGAKRSGEPALSEVEWGPAVSYGTHRPFPDPMLLIVDRKNHC